MDEEQLIHLVEMRSYLYDTSSFHCKNLNKVAAGWREIERELVKLLLAICCHFQ